MRSVKKHFACILVMVCLVTAILSSAAYAEETYIAKIKVVEGPVTIKQSGTDISPVAGGNLYEGDVIVTAQEGRVSIVFIDGTQLSVGSSSKLIVNRYLFAPKKKAYAFDLKIRKGSVIYSSGRLAQLSPDAVSIQTPQTTIGVRGTKFLVEVN